MDKRTWIAIGVFAVFLLAYQWWLSTKAPKPSQKPAPQKLEPAPETTKPKPQEAPKLPQLPDTSFITVETETFVAKLTRRGGVLASLTLKNFKAPDGKPLELVREPGLFHAPEDTALFSSAQGYIRVEKGQRVSLEFSDGSHKKVYTFEGTGYLLSFRADLPKLELYGPYLTERDRKADLGASAALWRSEKLHKEGIGKLKRGAKAILGGGLKWFGFRNHYFLWAFLPSSPVKTVEFRALSDSLASAKVLADSLSLVAYLGPIDPKALSSAGLEEVFSWGFFLIAPFAKAIYWMFVQLGRVIPNYGWVIVLFALLMKLAFFPLSLRTYRSMSKMQALKPKLEELQRKYKDDPQKLQEATLKLYQAYGVNPFSGCFPVLLQLPVFWALYQVLRNAIEFRMAPWVLWIQDLSYKDPYYILPVVMGAVSVLNTFLQPGVDRRSRMTSMLMAGLFVFIFLNLPAGIVLYWLTYNLYTTVEQAVIRAGGRRWST